jgi:hypothetical protein
MANTSTCLLTTVKNISGASKFFGFLPYNGQTLAANGTLTVLGDLMDAACRGGKPARYAQLIRDAIDADQLEIVSTPAVILYDATLANSKMLSLINGVLYRADPCWASTEYRSSL